MHVLAIEVAVPPSIVLYRVGVVVKRTPNSHPVVNKFCRVIRTRPDIKRA